MKRSIITCALALIAGITQAQEFKLAKSSGKLDISEVNNVVVEGHAGNEIIFTSRDARQENDTRAKGLRAVSSLGLEDNTGIGLSVIDKGATIEVRQLKKMDGPNITIKVPKGVSVSYTHTSPFGDEVEFSNVESEIEISTLHSGVNLSNVTGPMTVNTVHGSIDASLGTNLKSPVSIVSVHGHVDVALPVATKANLKLSTVYGEIYIDPDFKLDVEQKNNLKVYSSDTLNGKVNGGGIDITLSSTHNSVYLRKK